MAVDLAAFPGYTGWGAAEADADFAATGGAGKGASGGSSGGNGGNPLPAPPSIAEYSDKAYAPADEALKEYVMQLKSQEKPLDVYGQLETAMGLPSMKKTASTLREQIGGLEDTIRRVEPQVQATTRESLVTQGQQEGMIAERRRPLIDDLGVLGTALGRVSQSITAATADLGTRVSLFMEGQKQALKPYEVQLAALNDRAARQVTGFSADVENQLSVARANWERNNFLDDRQVEEAFELLKIEKNYQNELSKLIKTSEQEMSTYEKKKQVDQKYKVGTEAYDTTRYYEDNGSSGSGYDYSGGSTGSAGGGFDWSFYGLDTAGNVGVR